MPNLFFERIRNRVGRKFSRFSRISQFNDYTYGAKQKRTFNQHALTDEFKRQIALLLVFLAIGTVVGAIASNAIEYYNFNRLYANIYVYVNDGFVSGTAQSIIIEGIIKHGKFVAIIWLLGFIPRFSFLSFFIILWQGIGIGFTTAILTRGFGGAGVLYAAALYLPQNMIMIPVYFYAAISVLQQNKKRINDVERLERKSVIYYMQLVPFMAVVAIVSCFEWIITPVLFGFIV